MFYEKTIFEKFWGNLDFSFAFTKMDILPRCTASILNNSLILNIGFLWFSFNLTLWDKQMQEFNKSN
jgi:hypothetical protein